MPNIIYEKIPEFGQFVEYVTQAQSIVDQDGNTNYGVNINRVSVAQFVENINDEIAQTLLDDYEKVSSMRLIEDMDDIETEQVRQKLEEKYYSDVVTYTTKNLYPMSVISALSEVVAYPIWKIDIFVEVGDVYMYDDNLYEVIQAHTIQSDWTPMVAKSLWKRFYEPSDDPSDWIQPTGAHDAYPLGARVMYNGDIYKSTIAANVWSPDVTGWENLTAPEIGEWAVGVAYKVGDEVVYDGMNYCCLQAHTSQAGWEPSKVSALWEKY